MRTQVEQELASGQYQSPNELIEQAVRHFFDGRQRGQRRLDALRRIGRAGQGAAAGEGARPTGPKPASPMGLAA